MNSLTQRKPGFHSLPAEDPAPTAHAGTGPLPTYCHGPTAPDTPSRDTLQAWVEAGSGARPPGLAVGEAPKIVGSELNAGLLFKKRDLTASGLGCVSQHPVTVTPGMSLLGESGAVGSLPYSLYLHVKPQRSQNKSSCFYKVVSAASIPGQ